MKRMYRLEGLDCANCAAKLEKAIRKVDGIKEANINFMLLKLTIEFDDEIVIQKVLTLIKNLEPDVKVKRI